LQLPADFSEGSEKLPSHFFGKYPEKKTTVFEEQQELAPWIDSYLVWVYLWSLCQKICHVRSSLVVSGVKT